MRYVALWLSLAGLIVCLALTAVAGAFLWPALVCAALVALGAWDLVQPHHSLRRNYPILAHIRFALEMVRPEIRQYFLESDTDGVAVQPLQARRGLSARQGRPRQAAVRHAARRLRLEASNGSTIRSRRGASRAMISASAIGGAACRQAL